MGVHFITWEGKFWISVGRIKIHQGRTEHKLNKKQIIWKKCGQTFANCLFPEVFSSVLPLFAKPCRWTSPYSVITSKLVYCHKGEKHERLGDSGQTGACADWVFVEGDF